MIRLIWLPQGRSSLKLPKLFDLLGQVLPIEAWFEPPRAAARNAFGLLLGPGDESSS